MYFRTQSFTMEITHATTLFIAVITGEKTVFTNFNKEVWLQLIWDNYLLFMVFFMVSLVFNCSTQQNSVTWFEAQSICRDMNQSITVHKNESADYYWTGLYERTSHWIKIIGSLIIRYVYCYRIDTASHEGHFLHV